MIKGFFLDKVTWVKDYQANEFWSPEKHGIKVLMHPNYYDIVRHRVDPEYHFVITTDCWTWPAQKALKHLKKYGLRVYLNAREPIVPPIFADALFSYEEFKQTAGEYYFKPDIVFTSGQAYADIWKDKARCEIIGYPRFEQYLSKSKFDMDKIKEKYNIKKDKKIIFFPTFQSSLYKKVGGVDTYIDVYDCLEDIMLALEELSKDENIQVVVKIHPMSQQMYKKVLADRTFKNKDVAGTLRKYYEHKNDNLIVIGDQRTNGHMVKELLYASDLLVGFQSTMFFEAMFLDKPVISFIPKKLNKETGLYDVGKNIITVNSKDDLISLSKTPLSSSRDDAVMKKYLGEVDGKFCERICNIIKKDFAR